MPDWRAEVRAAIAHLNLDPAREQLIVDELAEHLSDKYDELIASAVREEEAFRLVLQELHAQKLGRRTMPAGWLPTGLRNEVRVAARLLRFNPGFAAAAILSLALGIGVNTAIFQLVDALILRTLPIPSPSTLASIETVHVHRMGRSVAPQQDLSMAQWKQLQQQRQEPFSSLAGWSTERFDLGRGGEARYADGLWVSGRFFQTLQIQPALGRLFSERDDYAGCGARGAVLSYAFWRGEFAGRPDILGQQVSLDRQVFQIIGVTPAAFYGLEPGRKFDLAVPLCSEPVMHPADVWSNSSTTWWLTAFCRLKPGWTFERASAQLAAISPAIFAATLPPQYDPDIAKSYLHFRFRAVPAGAGFGGVRAAYEYPLLLLLGISGLVLLVGCANVANLMLARAATREREMAVRISLGASRARLIRQLLIESLMLVIGGSFVGLALARSLSIALMAMMGAAHGEIFLSLAPDWRVLTFTAGLAIITCAIFGIAPAFRAAKTNPGIATKTAGRGLTAGREGLLLQRGFIVSQIALSLLLGCSALLFVRTFQNLANLNAGFDQEHILVADFDTAPLKLHIQSRLAYRRELLSQVRTIPGVVAAADTAIVPLSMNRWNEMLDFPGTRRDRELSNFSEVSSSYFRTLGIPLIAGRDFDETDNVQSPPVAIVNQAFAKTFLERSTRIGETFGVRQDAGKPDKMYRIIGIVGNTKYRDLREEYAPIAFIAETQDVEPDLDCTMLIRSNEDLAALISSIKAVAARVNPELVLNFSVLRTAIRNRLSRERLMAELAGFYGMLAALLTMVGLYGLVSYGVARRTSELGVRIALGATRSEIMTMIIRETFALLGIGLLAGMILVATAGNALRSLLFGLKPLDPLTLAAAIGAMALVALAASFLPARRAATLEPIETLRAE